MNPDVIVCAVEFSVEGKGALATALKLARWYEAEPDGEYVKNPRRPATSGPRQTSNWADRWRETIRTKPRQRCPSLHSS
jgi:hypothetical protein